MFWVTFISPYSWFWCVIDIATWKIKFYSLQGFRPRYRDSRRWTKQGSKTAKHYCISTWPLIETRFKSVSIHPNVLRCSESEPRACCRWIHNYASCRLSRTTWVCKYSFERYEIGMTDIIAMNIKMEFWTSKYIIINILYLKLESIQILQLMRHGRGLFY